MSKKFSNKEKLALSKNLKMLLARDDLTIVGLANKLGINRFQLDNILYNRAQSKETLEKISNFFKIPLEDLKYDIAERGDKNFNIQEYQKLVLEIGKIVLENNLSVAKPQMEKIIETLTKNHSKLKNVQYSILSIVLYLQANGEIDTIDS